MGVLATDDFNRANENPLANGVWTSTFGASDAFKIVSNAVFAATSGDDCLSTYTGVSWPNDQYGQVVLANIVNEINEAGQGIALRMADSNNLYRVVASNAASNNVTVAKLQSSSYSVLTQITQAFTNGDTFKVEIQGTTLRVYRNGAQIGSDVLDPTTTLLTGSVGMFSSGPVNTVASLDTFEGGDFAPVGPQNQLAWIRA